MKIVFKNRLKDKDILGIIPKCKLVLYIWLELM